MLDSSAVDVKFSRRLGRTNDFNGGCGIEIRSNVKVMVFSVRSSHQITGINYDRRLRVPRGRKARVSSLSRKFRHPVIVCRIPVLSIG